MRVLPVHGVIQHLANSVTVKKRACPKALRTEAIGKTERASRQMRPQRQTKKEFPERRRECVVSFYLKLSSIQK